MLFLVVVVGGMCKFALLFCCRRLARSTLYVLDAVTGMMVMAWRWRGLAIAPPDRLYHIIRSILV